MSKRRMPDPKGPRMYPAKYALIAMLGLALIAVVGSQWFYAYMQKRPIALWGKGASSAIMQSPKVLAVRLGEPGVLMHDGGVQIMTSGDLRRGVVERRDITQAPGLSHVRSSLIHDGTFDWGAPTDDCQPEWEYALEFLAGDMPWTIFFSPNCRRLKLAQTGAVATLKSSEGLERFLAEQFPKKNQQEPQMNTDTKADTKTDEKKAN